MRGFIAKKLFFLFIALFLILGSPFNSPLYSQQVDVERATRETDRLGPEKIEEKLREIPQKPAEAKPEEAAPETKEEEQKFFIKKINLLGCESFIPEDFASIIQQYENKELTFQDLETLAKELERDYLRRGVIAAVFVPPQEIKEETVTLQVVEARMGELKIEEHKYFNKKRLNYYWKTRPDEILHYDKISRDIQMMNKNPDREVRATLLAGKKPGTTDVLLTPKTSFPIHLFSSFDNEGSASTGKSRIGYGIRDNNFLGLDGTLLTGYSFGQSFSGIYAYHTLPVNSNGASLVYGYSRSISIPQKEFAVYGIKSKAENTSLSLHQDLYRKDEYLGEVSVGFEAKDKTTWMSTGTYTRDRLRVVSLGGNFLRRGFGSTTSNSLEISQGIDAFGASSKGNPLASRGAKSNFTKFDVGIQHRRALPLNLQGNLKFRAQVSSVKLMPQEELSLGGIDSVRGYPAGDYLADNAVSNSLELLIPSFFIPRNLHLPYAEKSLKEQTTAVMFVDYGWGQRRGVASTERKSANLLGIGGGLRLSLFNQALLRLEWGYPVAGNRPITESGRSRFHFSVDFQDKLPEEIERIRKLVEEENIKQWAWQLLNEELARPQSPLRQKLYGYLYLARQAYKDGRLKESKLLYERIAQIGSSLYKQAEDYVKACLQQQKELREYNKLASLHHKQGQLDQAKQLWQKIIKEAETKPLLLEF